MMLSTFFIVLVSVIAYVNCHCDSVTTSCTKDTVTASLAQSLHGIADALLANSQHSSCFCQPVPATTCEEIKKNWPSSASGYYTQLKDKEFTVIWRSCAVQEEDGQD